jgi:hypothetical protein
LPEFRLEAEPPRRPLCCSPDREEHDQEHYDDLAPEDFRSGQKQLPWWQTPPNWRGETPEFKKQQRLGVRPAAVASFDRQ